MCRIETCRKDSVYNRDAQEKECVDLGTWRMWGARRIGMCRIELYPKKRVRTIEVWRKRSLERIGGVVNRMSRIVHAENRDV